MVNPKSSTPNPPSHQNKKTTCHDGHSADQKKGHGCGCGHGKPANSSNERKLSHTLSELRSELELTGIPTAENILPDLVMNRVPDTVETVNTGEELEIADALLSLGEVRDDTIDDDDNAQLMPVGAPTGITDAVPVPVLLDQVKCR